VSRRVGWERRAQDDLNTIARRDRRLAQRIMTAITQYADNDLGDVRKLTGGDTYRLRVGEWRVLFNLEDGGRLMGVLRIMNRRDAYR
jgi:mRNA interferase RelE/StbE